MQHIVQFIRIAHIRPSLFPHLRNRPRVQSPDFLQHRLRQHPTHVYGPRPPRPKPLPPPAHPPPGPAPRLPAAPPPAAPDACLRPAPAAPPAARHPDRHTDSHSESHAKTATAPASPPRSREFHPKPSPAAATSIPPHPWLP